MEKLIKRIPAANKSYDDNSCYAQLLRIANPFANI